MGAIKDLGMRCAGVLVASLVALTGQPVLAQDGPPTDAELGTAAPGAGEVKESDGKADQVERTHVSRVKNIRSLFAKLKNQVDAMEQVQQFQQTAQLAPDLPQEALLTEDDPAPLPGETSVLDEAPKKPAKKGKPASPALSRTDDRQAIEERELADSAGGSTGTYTVQSGDTLGKIAAKVLGSSKKATAIAKANGMGVSEPLRVGRSLIIPGGGLTGDSAVGDVAIKDRKAPKKEKAAKSSRKPKNPASEPVLDYANFDFKMYTVKPGDSVPKIAKAFYENGNGADLIRKYNRGASGEKPLKPGDKILIPLPKQKAADTRYENAKKGVF